MQVREVMSRAAATDGPADTLRAAAARMWEQQTGSLLVLDGAKLVGILTERDVMKAVARGLDLAATPVAAVMTTQLVTVAPTATVHEAAAHMTERWIRHLPVLLDGRLVGVVSQRDLLAALAGRSTRPAAGEGQG